MTLVWDILFLISERLAVILIARLILLIIIILRKHFAAPVGLDKLARKSPPFLDFSISNNLFAEKVYLNTHLNFYLSNRETVKKRTFVELSLGKQKHTEDDLEQKLDPTCINF